MVSRCKRNVSLCSYVSHPQNSRSILKLNREPFHWEHAVNDGLPKSRFETDSCITSRRGRSAEAVLRCFCIEVVASVRLFAVDGAAETLCCITQAAGVTKP